MRIIWDDVQVGNSVVVVVDDVLLLVVGQAITTFRIKCRSQTNEELIIVLRFASVVSDVSESCLTAVFVGNLSVVCQHVLGSWWDCRGIHYNFIDVSPVRLLTPNRKLI